MNEIEVEMATPIIFIDGNNKNKSVIRSADA